MTASGIDQLVESASNKFAERFGRRPKWVVAAPGRVNIIGEHIDYNDGFVLPMAIDRYCVIAAAHSTGDEASIYSIAADEETKIKLALVGATGSASAVPNPGHWSNYVAGVIAG